MRTLQHTLLAVASLAAVTYALPSEASAQDCPECFKAPVVEVGDNPFVGSATGCERLVGECWRSFNTNFYSFTPTESGSYRISTCLKAVNWPTPVLTVWSGCSPADLIVCGFAGCPSGDGRGSLIGSIDLEAGVNYRIGIGSYTPGEDSFVESGFLTIEPIDPQGAGCASAGVAVVGVNAFDSSDRNEIVDLANECDPIPQGGPWDDRIYNATYFKFTPPKSGVYTMTTCGTVPFSTRMAVLRGCSPSDGVLGCTDGVCAPDQPLGSRIIGVALTAGVEYTLLIGGFLGGGSGAGEFSIELREPCPGPQATVTEIEGCGDNLNSGCESSQQAAQPIAVGDVIRGTHWALNGERDTDWYLLEISEGTEVTLTLHSVMDASATFYELDCTSGVFTPRTGYLCPGTTEGYCLAPGQYFVMVEPAQFWNHPCDYAAGNEYTLEVAGAPCDTTPPANDFCADAIAVQEGATPFDNDFATTDVAGEICSAPAWKDVWFTFTSTMAGDHWIRTCDGANPFDTGLDVWTDCPNNGGQVLACNNNSGDNDCGGVTSSVVLPMTAGQTVYIRVGSTVFFDVLTGASELVIEYIGKDPVCGDPDTGDCCEARSVPFCADTQCCNSVCAWDPTCCSTAWDQSCVSLSALVCWGSCASEPENNSCDSATPAVVGANTFRNNYASGSTATSCGVVHSDVWYTFTATSEQPATISFCASDGGWAYITSETDELDTRIAVFDSCSGTLVACNDNACGGAAKVTFSPDCGATYLIGIGSRDDEDGIYSQGIGSFVIVQSGACSGGCPADIDGDGEVSSSDLGALLSAWGTPAADLDGDGETGSSDLGVLLSAWGVCP